MNNPSVGYDYHLNKCAIQYAEMLMDCCKYNDKFHFMGDYAKLLIQEVDLYGLLPLVEYYFIYDLDFQIWKSKQNQ